MSSLAIEGLISMFGLAYLLIVAGRSLIMILILIDI